MVNMNWSWITNNIAVKAISVVIAIILWSVVLGSRNVEAVKEVPIEILTSSDVVPGNDPPDRVSFKLAGPKAFLRAIMDRREDPIRVNLVGSKPGIVNYRLFSDSIRLPPGIKVLSISPSNFAIRLEYVKKREVAVKLEVRGNPPEGFKLSRAKVVPSTVRIKGPQSKIESISELTTLPIDLSETRQSFEREVAFELGSSGIKVDGDFPKATIEVEAATPNFKLKNIEVRVLTSYPYKLSDKTVTVFIRASAKDLKNMDKGNIYAFVDLRGRRKGRHQEAVKVKLPDGVSLVRVVPEEVSVNLE